MLILVWSDGAMKLSVTCLSPFKILSVAALPPTGGVATIPRLVSPLAGAAHCTTPPLFNTDTSLRCVYIVPEISM